MKKTLTDEQMLELRKLGYMGDDSLAGLIEFLSKIGPFSMHMVEYDEWISIHTNEELCDSLYEAVKEKLESRK